MGDTDMKYAKVKSAGMQAFCDAYIIGLHDDATAHLYLISLSGTPVNTDTSFIISSGI